MGPDVALTTTVLVLVTPSVLLAVRSSGWTCWTGSSATWELQCLAPHASALALCQGKLVSAIDISAPCLQVEV